MQENLFRIGEVALAVGVSHSTVANKVAALGIKPITTKGGHRRLNRAQAQKVVRAIREPKPDPLSRIMEVS